MKTKYLYFVTTIRTIEKDNSILFNHRTVGFFEDKKNAEYCLEHDVGGLNEAGYYPWAVIEKIPEGLYPIPEQYESEFWEWKGKIDGHWERMKKPPEGQEGNNFTEVFRGEKVNFLHYASVG